MTKAIETHYNDYRFRSRLEARWAVFFDTLGVRYIYEREGFDLGMAGWYLPDFWLPQFDCWVEIKGNPTPESSAKSYALAKHTGKLVFMFQDCLPPEIKTIFDEDGVPDLTSYNYGYYYAPDGDCDGMQAFGICFRCNAVTLGVYGGHWVLCNEAHEMYKGSCGRLTHNLPSLYLEEYHPRILAAYAAARQARFEHGENGR